jgi:hypothetical protein
MRKAIKSKVLTHMRHILRLPSRASAVLAATMAKLIDIDGICARENYRFFVQLLHHPARDCLARQMLVALQAEPSSPSTGRRGRFPNLVHSARAVNTERLKSIGLPWINGGAEGVPMSYSDVARAAHVYARASAYTSNREVLHKKYPVPAEAADLIQLPPASHGSARHTATLHFYFYRDASALGTKAGRTPLSVAGPGCSGSLLALADKGQYRAVASAALGAEAILDWPFTGHVNSCLSLSLRLATLGPPHRQPEGRAPPGLARRHARASQEEAGHWHRPGHWHAGGRRRWRQRRPVGQGAHGGQEAARRQEGQEAEDGQDAQAGILRPRGRRPPQALLPLLRP